MTPDTSGQYVVTLRDVERHLSAKLDALALAVHTLELTMEKMQPIVERNSDHETRIRVLEAAQRSARWGFGAIGLSSGTISGIISDIIIHIHH
jgi:hypothetical protein